MNIKILQVALDCCKILMIISFGISAFCFGTVHGINVAHRDAINVGVAKYITNSPNGKPYVYWNTTNGYVREK